MANFEGLIRGALAAKGATTPEMRAVVYQSSRNALQRLISQNRSLTVENVVAEQQALEEAIARIEMEYAAPVAEPTPVRTFEAHDPGDSPPPQSEPQAPLENEVRQTDPFYEIEQVLAAGEAKRPTPSAEAQIASPEPEQPDFPQEEVAPQPQAPQPEYHVEPMAPAPQSAPVSPPSQPTPQPAPEPAYDAVVAEEALTVPPAFKRRRRSQAWIWFLFILVLLAVLAWIAYRLALGVVDGSLLGYQSGSSSVISRDAGQQDGQSDYITILEPGDLTAMVVSDRGRVEIINEQSLEMIRILSVRNKADRSQSAKPILIRLKPGVLEQIKGKRVTAEIYARSGTSKAAQFAVECQFGEGVGCGRKRFHVGVQPEASIFAFTIDRNQNTARDMHIAINTDITDNAEITGEGDVLDIVYLRLRTAKE